MKIEISVEWLGVTRIIDLEELYHIFRGLGARNPCTNLVHIPKQISLLEIRTNIISKTRRTLRIHGRFIEKET